MSNILKSIKNAFEKPLFSIRLPFEVSFKSENPKKEVIPIRGGHCFCTCHNMWLRPIAGGAGGFATSCGRCEVNHRTVCVEC